MTSRLVSVAGMVMLGISLNLWPAAAQDDHRAPVPGAVDSRVTQETIRRTICQRGYTTQVRPPRQFTNAVKRQLLNGHPGLL